jgi:hypothetical protein
MTVRGIGASRISYHEKEEANLSCKTKRPKTSKSVCSQAWWRTPLFPELQGLRREHQEFKSVLGYIVRPCLNTNKQTNKKYVGT